MAAVSLRKLSKVYPTHHAVREIDLEIEDRSFVVLVGPSGCGKSTTLRMIAGLEEISGGELNIGGNIVNHVPPGERNIAMVFQNYALYPHMTVAENIAFGLKQRKMPRAEIAERVAQAARTLQLEPLLNRKPQALSGGQRQRVAIGRAMVRNPAVFLFDEPLSNLDAKLRAQMRVEIKRLHQLNPTTTIYVTHDQIEAMTLADKVVVMNGGQIEQVGTPQELYHRPATRFVASFVGSPQMNMLEVAIHVADGAAMATMKDGQTFVFPPTSPPVIRRYDGKTLLLGIRPEHLRIAEEIDSGGFLGHVDLLEPLGHETLVYGAVGDERWCAKADPSTRARPAQSARLLPDFARAHLIDPQTDQVVTLAG